MSVIFWIFALLLLLRGMYSLLKFLVWAIRHHSEG